MENCVCVRAGGLGGGYMNEVFIWHSCINIILRSTTVQAWMLSRVTCYPAGVEMIHTQGVYAAAEFFLKLSLISLPWLKVCAHSRDK